MRRKGNAEGADTKATSNAGNANVLADFLLLLFKIVLVVLFFVILFTCVFGITQVRDNSMAPAFREGDLVIYYRFDRTYNVQDAIALSVDGETEVRRVVAVAGDEVDMKKDGLAINGNMQIESNIYTQTLPYVDGITFPVTLADDQVFVLGDNRTESRDSRIYGPVEKKATRGKVVTCIRRRGF
ncbi:MAG: signal peptidase I [Lachnospiraceae bacterium]|nr:signal peptidase I [Lachnospiraceae bacterium]